MNVPPLELRIYVASLSDYNAGRLHGVWIDAAEEIDAVWSQINAMLASSPEPNAEEFAIHDHDGFAPCQIGEYDSIDHVAKIAAGIAQHGEAFACWASLSNATEPDELDRFEDTYVGSFDSVIE